MKLITVILSVLTTSNAATVVVQGPPRIPLLSSSGSTLNTGLAAYWKLDETSGTRVDSEPTGSPQDLTDINTVTNVAGIIGNAAYFTQANQEILLHSDSSDLSVSNIDFSVVAWFNMTDQPGDMVAVSHFAVSPNQRAWRVWFNSSLGKMDFTVSSDGLATTDVIANSFGNPGTNSWHMVVVSHDSVNNTINISVDGGTVDSLSYSLGVKDSSGSFMIGARETASWWDGAIDEVALFKKVLTPAEIAELYNAGAGKTCCPF